MSFNASTFSALVDHVTHRLEEIMDGGNATPESTAITRSTH
jgi:hypothetical protein